LIFGLVNALIRPIITLLTCPLVIITLGLFILVINAIMLLITANLSGGRLVVDGFGTAFIGGIIMGIIGVVLEGLLGVNEKKEEKQ
jgi:putative membrane protein